MKLIWSGQDKSGKGDGPKPPQDREIQRNCGQILGQMDALMPFLYLTQHGAAEWELRQQHTETAVGLFAVGERDDKPDRPGVVPRVGLILPVRMCRDEATRAALLELAALLGSDRQSTMSDRRRAVQAKLDEAFGGDFVIAEKESLDGFFALAPSQGLFQRLHESFDYVTEVVDNAAGEVCVASAAPFHWCSYGELMEWHYRLRGGGQFHSWVPMTPMMVCGSMAALPRYSAERWAENELRRPAEEPSRWFVIRAGLPNAKIGIRLEMREYGWARLYLSLDERSTEIHLSEVFDPFGELVAWGREIAEGNLPIEMEIDEEGLEAILTVLCTDDPARVLLRITRKYENEILLEGVVARTDLAKTMKAELLRFFTTEFDPQHWDERDNDREEGYLPLRDRVLQNPWLASPE